MSSLSKAVKTDHVSSTAVIQRQKESGEARNIVFEAEEVILSQVQVDLVVNTLQDVANHAFSNAISFVQDVILAIDRFKAHANSRIEDLEGEFTVGDLVVMVFDTGLGFGFGRVMKEIEEVVRSELGKMLFDAIALQILVRTFL